jgi:endonuclease YncB( thermonuclease family)
METGKHGKKMIGKMLFNLLLHKRILLFWGVAALCLVMPWLLESCARTALRTSQVYEHCSVLSIHDGDTMKVRCNGQKIAVRLYCIDAPELGQKPWGQESRDYLRSITPAQVKVIPRTKDRYGRIVGEVITSDEQSKNLNLAMAWAGQAVVYNKYCNVAQYYQAEGEAKETRAGIWQKFGVHQRPWEWRHR